MPSPVTRPWPLAKANGFILVWESVWLGWAQMTAAVRSL
jgi:hypothetical protein